MAGGAITGFVYLIGTILIGLGLAGALFGFSEIIKWKRATKIIAQIVEVSDETWNDGRVRFQYAFQFGGQLYTIWGPWCITFNPLLSLSPQSQIGKQVPIRFDNRKLKIVQSPMISVLFGVIGVGVSFCGVVILVIV